MKAFINKKKQAKQEDCLRGKIDLRTQNTSSCSSALTTALTFFLFPLSSLLVFLQLATINILSKHTLFLCFLL